MEPIQQESNENQSSDLDSESSSLSQKNLESGSVQVLDDDGEID